MGRIPLGIQWTKKVNCKTRGKGLALLYLSRLSWVQDRVSPQGWNKPEGIFLKELIVQVDPQVISCTTFFIF